MESGAFQELPVKFRLLMRLLSIPPDRDNLLAIMALDKLQPNGIDDTEYADISNHGDATSRTPRLDPHGLPLVPQPSADPMDPLNWKLWLKVMVLVEVSVLSFLALLSASLIVSCLSISGTTWTESKRPLSRLLDTCVCATVRIRPPQSCRDRICNERLRPLCRHLHHNMEPHLLRLRYTPCLHHLYRHRYRHVCRFGCGPLLRRAAS